MCPVSGQSRVMAAIVLTSFTSDGLEQFPKDPGPRITFLRRINWQLQHFMKINKTLSNEAEMNRLALWSSSHSTNHPHTFLMNLTHSGIYPSFILLQHYTVQTSDTVATVKLCGMHDRHCRLVAASEIMAAKCLDEKLYIWNKSMDSLWG